MGSLDTTHGVLEPMGSMEALTQLALDGNQIGDSGLQALAGAIGNGSLPACKTIVVFGNPGNAAPLTAPLKAATNNHIITVV